MIYAIALVIGSLILFEVVVIKQSKKSHYEAWKREFERELGSSAEKVDEIVIKELYETTQSPKSAAEYYLETKQVELEILWKRIEATRIELLTIEECIERYDLTEEQIKKLKGNRNA